MSATTQGVRLGVHAGENGDVDVDDGDEDDGDVSIINVAIVISMHTKNVTLTHANIMTSSNINRRRR